ncbi:MAG: C2H2-type zinc finger protein [Smithella sp.]|jgi:hypothetical protein
MNKLFAYYFPAPVIVQVKCQICDEIIATLDLTKVKLPITGEMFKSHDRAHGVPDPFYPGCEFEFMRCPYGGHRPMILPDKILTVFGLLNIRQDGSYYFTNPGSDRDFILDREQMDRQSPPPMMSEEEAGRLARGLPVKENIADGETEIQQGQTEVQQPIESKAEAKDLTSPFSSDGNKKPVNYCVECDRQFKNAIGYNSHMKHKHPSKPED